MPDAHSNGSTASNQALPNGRQQLNGSSANETYDDSPFLPDEQLSLPDLCARIHRKVHVFLATPPRDEQMRSVQEQTKVSLGVIEDALKRYDLSSLCLSYNGGKDCLVLLILYLAALSPYLSRESGSSSAHPPKLQTVYIVSDHPFAEVETFVQSTSKIYNLSLTRYDKDMKTAFTEYLHDFPAVKAIFVGTRRTDPHGANLTHFDPTDHGWPSFMRIHPVIDWHYVDIWTFIRYLKIPYCPLYDKGYTSLGGTRDTNPNPALRRQSVTESGKPTFEFRPAYELVQDEEERLGRQREWKATKGSSLLHRVEGGANEVAVVDDDDDEP